MPYQQILDHCFGNAPSSKARADALLGALAPALADFQSQKDPQAAAILSLAARQNDLSEITTAAEEIKRRFDRVVVAGMGGSSMCGESLVMLAPASAKCPTMHFINTIDPHAIEDLLHHCRTGETFFILISRSGTTAETLAHLHVFLDHARERFGEGGISERFLFITLPGDNPMRKIAQSLKIRVFDHDADIGGRFANFTNVGLLPAAIAGFDIAKLRSGAAQVIDAMNKATHPRDCAPAMGAAIQCAHVEAGRNISVMMPYSHRLRGFSAWYRQCWAESLGKNGKGSTPVRASGPTDQHSQLQLYLEGPKDKFFTLVTLTRAGTGQPIRLSESGDLEYLQNRKTGDLMAAQQKATLATLASHGCPVRLIEMSNLNEVSVGALLMHFMLEIMFASRILKVNPFDQPAVEEGKILARDYLLAGDV